MSKDPAVLFYTSDFLSGTSFFTDEQKGQYITLLCQQHQLGSIPKNHMISICKSSDSPVITKFVVDDHGNYYNERMRLEAEKRANFCASRSNNKSGRPSNEIIRKSHDNHMSLHMDNGNDNKNTTTQQIQEVFEFFCFTLRKKILLSKDRQRIIELRLKEGRSVEELKRAITNFSMDDWADRHKFCDLVYAIGVRNKVDNLDKWLVGKNGSKPVPASHPKTCPECFGNGLVYPQGGGKAVVCWIKFNNGNVKHDK